MSTRLSRRLTIKTLLLLIALSGASCGGSDLEQQAPKSNRPRNVRKTVGMWVQLLWFNDPKVNYYPWSQYTRIKPHFGEYSSSDEMWISYTIENAETLGVDYLILDNTNGVFRHDGYFDLVIENYLRIIKNKRSNIKIAIATGYEIFEKKDWVLFNESLAHLAHYYNNPAYYRPNEKPMLVLYINPEDYISTILSRSGISDPIISGLANERDKFGYKNYLPNIDVRYASGSDRWIVDVDGVYGWKFEYPQSASLVSMGVMPGWNRSHNQLTGSQPLERASGEYYSKAWERILDINPENVIITSWDDWAEETAIAPASSWDDLYFNLTKKYISLFKSN